MHLDYIAQGPRPDWLLEKFAELANAGHEIRLTVCLGGMVVTGTTISAARYFEGLLSGLPEAIRAEAKASADSPDRPGEPAAFLHLRDAMIYGLGDQRAPIPSNGMLWRGRLSAVTGFFMGILRSVEPGEDPRT